MGIEIKAASAAFPQFRYRRMTTPEFAYLELPLNALSMGLNRRVPHHPSIHDLHQSHFDHGLPGHNPPVGVTLDKMVDFQNLRGIIFDLDGVLVDSTSCHRETFDQIFCRFGISQFHYPSYAGRRTTDVIQEVFASHGLNEPPEVIAQAARDKSRLASQLFEQRRPITPGCERVLAELASRFPLALASSGSRASVEAFLRVTGSASLFRSILTAEDVVDAKPAPEIYLRSAKRMGLNPAECLVVEDAISGVKAARAAGAMTVGIPGTSSAAELQAAGAQSIASTLVEMAARFSSGTPVIDIERWTAVIPAAGNGSRLGFHRPKILYPVCGRPILDWLLDYLSPCCHRFVFVLSPHGSADVSAELESRIPGRFEVVIQQEPTGMGDAVGLALPRVQTAHMAVVWGDQVALRPESVETCLRLHQGPLHPGVTFPTVLRREPYIHFERDVSGQLMGVRQKREGDAMPTEGESDVGFFCFNPTRLSEWLENMRLSKVGSGVATREFNLLPVIPLAASLDLVLTPRVVSQEEAIGVNCVQDASTAEGFLRRASGVRI